MHLSVQLLLNHLVAYLIAVSRASGYFKTYKSEYLRRINTPDKKVTMDDYNKVCSEVNNSLYTVRFITASAFLISLIFIIVYYLQQLPQDNTPTIIADVLSTGIQIPAFLALLGYVLNKQIPSLPSDIKRIAFIVVTIAIDVDFLLFDWKLALFVFSIIVGKYVWIDFVYEWKDVLKTFECLYKSEILYDRVIILFVETSTQLFYLFSIVSYIFHNVLKISSEDVFGMMTFIYLGMFVSNIIYFSKLRLKIRYNKE